MFYEFRTYTCMPGKLPVVLNRFKATTLGLFRKHGFKTGPLYMIAVGEDNNQVKYMLEWESHAQRDAAWVAFRADPEWAQAVALSEKDGPTVARISNELLTVAPFSLES